MELLDLSTVSEDDLKRAAKIARDVDVNLDDCYQCGKCSAGCSMAHAMDLMPRQVIRLLQLGFTDRALDAKAPWICVNCEICSARCPQGVDICDVMLSVRRTAKKSGRQPVREADVFDDAFLGNIRSFGKSNEAILAGKYNLFSGHLMQDALTVPGMLSRGLIGPKIHHVKDRKAVKRLVDRCLKQKEQDSTTQTTAQGEGRA